MAEGGCLCGGVRYRVEGPPSHADFCHCRQCQKSAGAPVVAWGSWPADRFVWLHGEPAVFAFSPNGRRAFCPACGGSLAFLDPGDPGVVEVTLASLDDPSAVAPADHIWTASQVPWLELADGKPRHAGARGA